MRTLRRFRLLTSHGAEPDIDSPDCYLRGADANKAAAAARDADLRPMLEAMRNQPLRAIAEALTDRSIPTPRGGDTLGRGLLAPDQARRQGRRKSGLLRHYQARGSAASIAARMILTATAFTEHQPASARCSSQAFCDGGSRS
jgi:hypothetical protein